MFEAFLIFWLIEILVLFLFFIFFVYEPKKETKKIYDPWGFWKGVKNGCSSTD